MTLSWDWWVASCKRRLHLLFADDFSVGYETQAAAL